MEGGIRVGLIEILQREFVYISYYFMVQLRQIFFYWILGIVIGSFVSVFAKDAIHGCFERIKDKKWSIFGVIPASLLGIASPLCMYGTIPIVLRRSRTKYRKPAVSQLLLPRGLYCKKEVVDSGAHCSP